MNRTFAMATLAGAFALACLPGPSWADHQARDLEVTLRLNDDSYCPGGRMWGREGAEEGRDDQVWASVSLRSTASRPVDLRNARGEVTVRDEAGRVVTTRPFTVSGRFTRTSRRIQNMRLRPSDTPGRYTVSVWVSAGTVRDSARFSVDYDPAACPRDRRPGSGVVVRIPPIRIPIPVPSPRPLPLPLPGPGRYPQLQDSLRVSLRVAWSCKGQGASRGFDTATVTVYNTHPQRAIRVAGLGTHGLQGLGAMNAVNRQPGWLRPGEHITFHARGHLTPGRRRAVAYVTNYPEVRDGRVIDVDCQSWIQGPCFLGIETGDKS